MNISTGLTWKLDTLKVSGFTIEKYVFGWVYRNSLNFDTQSA